MNAQTPPDIPRLVRAWLDDYPPPGCIVPQCSSCKTNRARERELREAFNAAFPDQSEDMRLRCPLCLRRRQRGYVCAWCQMHAPKDPETIAQYAQAATERDADSADEEELAAAASILTKGQR